MIDLYCERLGPGLLAEPANAISNLAFFIAGIGLIRVYQRVGLRSFQSLALITLLFAIGVGSTLFHTFASPWAQQADVIPILLFQLTFLGAYSYGAAKLPWHGALFLLAIFVLSGLGISALQLQLNGSDTYLAALIFLSGLGIYHRFNEKPEPYLLLLAALTFLLSLVFRTVDIGLCEGLPIGTHFIWHILNSFVLYLCGRAYMLAAVEAPRGLASDNAK